MNSCKIYIHGRCCSTKLKFTVCSAVVFLSIDILYRQLVHISYHILSNDKYLIALGLIDAHSDSNKMEAIDSGAIQVNNMVKISVSTYSPHI